MATEPVESPKPDALGPDNLQLPSMKGKGADADVNDELPSKKCKRADADVDDACPGLDAAGGPDDNDADALTDADPYNDADALTDEGCEAAASQLPKNLESWDAYSDAGDFVYAMLLVFTDDDAVLFGKLSKSLEDATAEEFHAALAPVSDSTVFPALPDDPKLTICPGGEEHSHEHYIKRPDMFTFARLGEAAGEHLRETLLDEALVLHRIAQNPHPNMVRSCGVRVARGRITGLVIEKHENNLFDHVGLGLPIADHAAFMDALRAAVEHLHSIGLAHNDLNPYNVMVSKDGMPVLIDFGSCAEFGANLTNGGTPGWVENLETYMLSEKGNDEYALKKVSEWLKAQVEETV